MKRKKEGPREIYSEEERDPGSLTVGSGVEKPVVINSGENRFPG